MNPGMMRCVQRNKNEFGPDASNDARNSYVEDAALVVHGFSRGHLSGIASAELLEVLRSLGSHIIIELREGRYHHGSVQRY